MHQTDSAASANKPSVEKIKSAIVQFLSLPDQIEGTPGPRAFVASGKWGVGKTFFWKALTKQIAQRTKKELGWRGLLIDTTIGHYLFVRSRVKAPANKNYSYVSLFGINSLEELKVETFVNSDSFLRLAEPRIPEYELTRWKLLWKWLNQKRNAWGFIRFALNGASIPHVSSPSKILGALAAARTRDALICFDDLERRGDGLKLKDLLGYISYLCEQKNCTVVAICNDDAMETTDQETWKKNKEKIFSHNIEFMMTPEEQCALIFGTGSLSAHYSTAIYSIQELGICNLRIIQRIKDQLDLVFSLTPHCSDDAARHIAKSLTWIFYCHLGSGGGAPPLGRTSGHIGFLMGNKSDTRTEAERHLDEVIYRYGYSYGEGFNDYLQDMVIYGFFDHETLDAHAKKYDANATTRRHRERFDTIWDVYSNNINDNSTEVLHIFQEEFSNVIGTLGATDIDNAVYLLRLIEEASVADNAVDQWIEHHKALGKIPLPITGRQFEDERLRAAAEKAIRETLTMMPLEVAMNSLSGDDKTLQLATTAIANTAVEVLADYLTTHPGKTALDATEAVLRLPKHPNYPSYDDARSVMRSAIMSLIEKSSPIVAKKLQHLYGRYLSGP